MTTDQAVTTAVSPDTVAAPDTTISQKIRTIEELKAQAASIDFEAKDSKHILSEEDRVQGRFKKLLIGISGRDPNFVKKEEWWDESKLGISTMYSAGWASFAFGTIFGAFKYAVGAGSAQALIAGGMATGLTFAALMAIVLFVDHEYVSNQREKFRLDFLKAKGDVKDVLEVIENAKTPWEKWRARYLGFKFLGLENAARMRTTLATGTAAFSGIGLLMAGLSGAIGDSYRGEYNDEQAARDADPNQMSNLELEAFHKGRWEAAKLEVVKIESDIRGLEGQLSGGHGAVDLSNSEYSAEYNALQTQLQGLEDVVAKRQQDIATFQELLDAERKGEIVTKNLNYEYTAGGKARSQITTTGNNSTVLNDGNVTGPAFDRIGKELAQAKQQLQLAETAVTKFEGPGGPVLALQAKAQMAAKEVAAQFSDSRQEDLGRKREELTAARERADSLSDYKTLTQADPKYMGFDPNFNDMFKHFLKVAYDANPLAKLGMAVALTGLIYAEMNFLITANKPNLTKAEERMAYHALDQARAHAEYAGLQSQIKAHEAEVAEIEHQSRSNDLQARRIAQIQTNLGLTKQEATLLEQRTKGLSELNAAQAGLNDVLRTKMEADAAFQLYAASLARMNEVMLEQVKKHLPANFDPRQLADMMKASQQRIEEGLRRLAQQYPANDDTPRGKVMLADDDDDPKPGQA